MSAARIGDPLDEATEVGPLAQHDLRNTLRPRATNSQPAVNPLSMTRRLLIRHGPCQAPAWRRKVDRQARSRFSATAGV